MKIRFSKRRLYAHLLIGVVWMTAGILSLYSKDFTNWIGFVYLILGLLYISYSAYDFKHPYISIENGIVKKNKLYGFKNKIELDKIQEIKRTTSGYILKSEKTYLKIDSSLISNEKLIELIELFRNLNLPQEKTFLKAAK